MRIGSGVSAGFVNVLNGMGQGLFASLIIGLILKQAGAFAGVELLVRLGTAAQLMMGPAIAAAVARSLDAPPLAVLSSLVVGAVGAGTFAGAAPAVGEPMGAAVAAVLGALAGKAVSGRGGGSLDILLVPLCVILVGGLAGVTAAPYVARLMKALGALVNAATEMRPFAMGIVVSTIMGVVLTLPISSAALAISLDLSGLAAGAATVGCCCQMVGFAVASFRDNGVGGLIAQGVGTSMIQMPNIVRNPWIWLPPTLASALLGPASTVLFRMENNSVGAGMGTSGLVGQVGTFAVMGSGAWPGIVALHVVLPALLSLAFVELLRRKGRIRAGDMALSVR